jgi:hypothetical protein
LLGAEKRSRKLFSRRKNLRNRRNLRFISSLLLFILKKACFGSYPVNPTTANPIPEIFILWHPACGLGELLARRIYSWLRPGNGLGPQVFYRSVPSPESSPGGLPLPLPGEPRNGHATSQPASRLSNLQVVLLLIDEQMIADAAWRYWLVQLGLSQSVRQRKIIPIALDSTAFNLPAGLRELNFLRPTGVPLPPGGGTEEVREKIVRSLLKQLTELLCHLMLSRSYAVESRAVSNPGSQDDDVAPKIKIFLSHAKADGTVPASRIRDYIYSQTQLAAFYDENDIPFASVFSRVLENDLEPEETAALIAVRSAEYANRPWCRRELASFRRPRQDKTPVGPAERWRLNPILVVDAVEGGRHSPGIPEIGNASLIRWANDLEGQEEQIVITTLRDVMLSLFHLAVGRTLPEDSDTIILNWLPDPTTLLLIPRVKLNESLKVFYPGRGLSGLELDILDEFFPHLEFHSFEEAMT